MFMGRRRVKGSSFEATLEERRLTKNTPTVRLEFPKPSPALHFTSWLIHFSRIYYCARRSITRRPICLFNWRFLIVQHHQPTGEPVLSSA
jgi:hypothetical protein